VFVLVLCFSQNIFAQEGHKNKPLPVDGLYLENLTWPELKAKIDAGFTTVIVPTGGTEQGGPHLALGKHNFVVKQSAMRIATNVGRTLVAPVLPYVPEGDFASPSGNLLFPGTLGVSDETFFKVLIDISVSLYLSGFKCIVFLGDHGQSIELQGLVAEQLNIQWKTFGVRVINLSAYYDSAIEHAVLSKSGIDRADWGEHAGVADTSELMAVRSAAVRLGALRQKDVQDRLQSGATGRGELATKKLGSKMLELRAQAAGEQLKSLLSQ
jgi:creatinine amidohydrolase/Fe(II)-dependent formamide hydrolase-like protein